MRRQLGDAWGVIRKLQAAHKRRLPFLEEMRRTVSGANRGGEWSRRFQLPQPRRRRAKFALKGAPAAVTATAVDLPQHPMLFEPWPALETYTAVRQQMRFVTGSTSSCLTIGGGETVCGNWDTGTGTYWMAASNVIQTLNGRLTMRNDATGVYGVWTVGTGGGRWDQRSTGWGDFGDVVGEVFATDQITPEERAAMAAREAAAQARYEEERRLRLQAEARANLLLEQHLAAEQRESLRVHGYFNVRSQRGNHYRIHRGRSMNVKQIDSSGRVIEVLCAYPPDVPDADAMLSQKLMLELAEDQFLAVAVKHGARLAGWVDEPPRFAVAA